MRPLLVATITVAVGGILTPLASAQTLNDRIAGIRDGAIRLSFATRAGVCGDGEFIGEDTPGGFRTYAIHRGGFSISTCEHVQPACNTGPLRLVVEKTGGRIRDLAAAVGVSWRAGGDATDLGMVPAAEAARWLVDLAPQLAGEDDVRVALFTASMADSARIAERMMAMGRDRNLPMPVRTSAMRWLRGPAEREGRAGAADRTLRDVARDAAEPAELREQALRRLGESRSDENASWLREMVLDRAQPPALRERALRVLGEELDRADLVRQLYPRLDHVVLEERAVRVVGERRGDEAADWLRQTAEDRDGHETVRERAVRELAARGVATTELVRLYDRADNLQVRARLIRIFGERGDPAAMDKLAAIVRDDTHPSLRRDAQRRLAERMK